MNVLCTLLLQFLMLYLAHVLYNIGDRIASRYSLGEQGTGQKDFITRWMSLYHTYASLFHFVVAKSG